MATVAILGGGVGGLSAAHELIERGYEVDVYERNAELGGKARSIPVADSGVGGRADLPAEHGFRFFPGFYRHLTDTMSRIPTGSGFAVGHLTPATQILLAQSGRRNELIAPTDLPTTPDELTALMRFLWDFAVQLRIPPTDLTFFLGRMLTFLLSCDERREQQWENMSWWDFTDADARSAKYRRFLVDGLTRSLVAAQARHMSARTGGLILWQILFDMVDRSRPVDRVLDGPTSEVWIEPWVRHLEQRGVRFHRRHEVTGIRCSDGRVSTVVLTSANSGDDESTGGVVEVTADHFISALPVERLDVLITPELKAAEPRLAGLKRLITRWMNGVIFFLDRDVPLGHGHALFVDSEWALTAISQKQFWPDVDLSARGDGTVRGILSVDVSDWYTPGRRTGKPAIQCTEREIREEVWGQILDHIDDGSLDRANIVDWFLDPAIGFPDPAVVTNAEPLLINTAGSLPDRPPAATAIPNLFLAADFVRTHTDLATMEAANEAARAAVNGILHADGSGAPRCTIYPLHEPEALRPLRDIDAVRWRLERSLGAVFGAGRNATADLARKLPDAVFDAVRLFR
jgi:uncharacterized protein with NAD-binding domain and iron-sulfur cluster